MKDAAKRRSKIYSTEVHREILSAFHIPLRDRYQIYQEHVEPRLIVEDTGLAIERIRNAVVVTITSRQRKPEAKQVFLQGLCRELKASCDIDPVAHRHN
jgi:hypothetical protein